MGETAMTLNDERTLPIKCGGLGIINLKEEAKFQ